jgi:hypothetical protein
VSALGVVVLPIALLAQWGRKDGNEQLEVLFSVWNLISILFLSNDKYASQGTIQKY